MERRKDEEVIMSKGGFGMFTDRLDAEARGKFLELVYKLASCDGGFGEEEQEIIDNYRNELSVHEIPDTASISELADYFGKKENLVKKIVLFEVCGIILSDHDVGEKEQEAFDYMKKALALDGPVTEEIISVANDLKIIRDRIADIVFA